MLEDGKVLEHYLAIFTKGITPALETYIWSHVNILSLKSPIFERYSPISSGISLDLGGEGRNLNPIGDWPPTEEQITGLKDGSMGLFHWGRIDYKDAFGDAHFTEFRFITMWGNDSFGLTLTCPEGNNVK